MMQSGRFNGAAPWHTWTSFMLWMERQGFTLIAHTLDRIFFRHKNGRWMQVPQPVRMKVVRAFIPKHGDLKNRDALLDDRLCVTDDVVFEAVRLAQEISGAP